MTATTQGRHRAPDPDVDPVTRAVEALRGWNTTLDAGTARLLLNSWKYRDTLTAAQRHEVVTIVTANVDQPTAVTR